MHKSKRKWGAKCSLIKADEIGVYIYRIVGFLTALVNRN